jgi:hypothetical protein
LLRSAAERGRVQRNRAEAVTMVEISFLFENIKYTSQEMKHTPPGLQNPAGTKL